MVRYAALFAILFLWTPAANAACYPEWTCASRDNSTDNLNRAYEERARQQEMDALRRQRDDAGRAYARERAIDAQRREESRRDPSGIMSPRRHY